MFLLLSMKYIELPYDIAVPSKATVSTRVQKNKVWVSPWPLLSYIFPFSNWTNKRKINRKDEWLTAAFVLHRALLWKSLEVIIEASAVGVPRIMLIKYCQSFNLQIPPFWFPPESIPCWAVKEKSNRKLLLPSENCDFDGDLLNWSNSACQALS